MRRKKTPRSLEKVLDLCIEMWKWIISNKSSKTYDKWGRNIEILKDQWLRDHAYATERNGPESDCFFCQYATDHGGGYDGNVCPNCPGRVIDPSYTCLDPEYDYRLRPVEFYKKLLSLRRTYRRQMAARKTGRNK